MIPIGYVEEYRFAPPRRWRFDYAWPEQKVALEVEGGIFLPGGGRHTRGIGYQKDMEKYNEATKLGWRVFRYTPQQVKRLEHYETICKMLHITRTAQQENHNERQL